MGTIATQMGRHHDTVNASWRRAVCRSASRRRGGGRSIRTCPSSRRRSRSFRACVRVGSGRWSESGATAARRALFARGREPAPDALLEAADNAAERPDARVSLRESVGLAFVTALQFLPPKQGAALILVDVLGW